MHEGEEVNTAIIGMVHAMNLKVVAEGVETKTQLDFLCDRERDYIQGFYYYYPLSASDVGELLYTQMSESNRIT